jgi:hypothetical protein
VHALQRMEQENAWVRRPPQWLANPLDKSLARIAWVSFFMLLPLLRRLPGLQGRLHASLFQNIMSCTLPYNRLHAAVRASPFVWLLLLAGVFMVARVVLGSAWRLLAALAA